MIIAVIAPEDVAAYCKSVIRNENPEVTVIEATYTYYMQAPEIVKSVQDKVDGILFGGKTPYMVTEKSVAQKVPWSFLDRETGTLFRAILEAYVILKKDIRKVSFDSYDEDMITMAYSDIGIKENELNIYIAQQRLQDSNYHEYLKNFHINNFKNKNISCVITGFTEIYNYLRNKNIPCVRMIAPKNTVLLGYHKIEKRWMESDSKDKETVVLDIKFNFSKLNLSSGYQQYFQLCNKNKAAETIYLFAAKIEAAVVEIFNDRFMIFTTYKKLSDEMGDSFESLYLFNHVRDVNIRNMNIGIGYGNTMAQAQDNAEIGLAEAEKAGENIAIIVSGKGKKGSRIKLMSKGGSRDEPVKEEQMYELSHKTGISTASLWKIYSGVQYFNGKDITSQKLATVCEMSKRNMDRLILKLENAGACEIIGEYVEGKSGRPTRMLKFHFFDE